MGIVYETVLLLLKLQHIRDYCFDNYFDCLKQHFQHNIQYVYSDGIELDFVGSVLLMHFLADPVTKE